MKPPNGCPACPLLRLRRRVCNGRRRRPGRHGRRLSPVPWATPFLPRLPGCDMITNASKFARQTPAGCAASSARRTAGSPRGAARHRNALVIGCIQTKGPPPLGLKAGISIIIIVGIGAVRCAEAAGHGPRPGPVDAHFQVGSPGNEEGRRLQAKDGSEPVEGRVINHPQAGAPESRTGYGMTFRRRPAPKTAWQ